MALSDRFFTPATARALLSWRLAVGVAVAVVAALAGLNVFAAIGLGVLVYAAAVSMAMPRATTVSMDPFALSEPWRHFVLGTQRARQSLREAVQATADGPLKDRLADIAGRLQQAVEESWAIAKRGDEIDAAVTRIDPVRLRSRLSSLEDGVVAPDDDTGTDATDLVADSAGTSDLAQARASIESQLASTDRLKALSASTADRLRLTQARLDELVARAAEVSVGTSDTDTYAHDVDNLVVELEGLRLAVVETDQVT